MTLPRLRVLTWHVHGTYLQLLGLIGHDIFVPVDSDRSPGYAGLPPGREWPDGLHEVPVDRVSSLEFDCILFQSDENWAGDQHRILTDEQRSLPRLYLEHDPPGHDGGSCFSSRHPVDDPDVTIVHVTPFNRLMWDSGEVPSTVIEHAVIDRGYLYRGGRPRGIVAVNDIAARGRRLGYDLYTRARRDIPLDLIGLGSAGSPGGLGEIPPDEVGRFVADYRFFFHPIRYTSLGLALCEAMMVGMPVVALATTEAVTVIEDGVSGYVSTDPDHLIAGMERLLGDHDLAIEMGRSARASARRRFTVSRFASDWSTLLERVCGRTPEAAAGPRIDRV